MNLAQIKTEAVLSDLKLQNLPPKKKQEIYTKLQRHFTRFILISTLSFLNEEQFGKFKQYLKETEAGISALCSEVPGLKEFLEQRLEQEYQMLKSFIKVNA